MMSGLWHLEQICSVVALPGPSGNCCWAIPDTAQSSAGTRVNRKSRMLRQRRLAELDALADLGDRVRSCRNLVLQLDAGREFVLLLPHQAQDVANRRVALAPGEVRAAVRALFPVLQVDAGDAVVMLLDQRNGAFARARHVVATIEIDGVSFGLIEHRIPRRQRRLRMGV